MKSILEGNDMLSGAAGEAAPAPEQLPREYRKLFRAAIAAAGNAYAPYSHFRVGAALLTQSGAVYRGVNVENASYGVTMCAERSAVSAAVCAGERSFAALAVASPDGAAYPCGACRQVIYEFGSDIDIITGESEEKAEVYKIKELLPKGFRL